MIAALESISTALPEKEIHSEGVLPTKPLKNGKGQNICGQLDPASNDKVEVAVATQVGYGEGDSIVALRHRKPEFVFVRR